MLQRKRKQMNIEEKSRIISKLEQGIPNKDLAKEYGVTHSTISNIWKEREKIKMLFENNILKRKRARTSNHTKIEEALLKWFKDQRNVLINGPILQQKANEFAQHFGEDFVCSASWIQRFRTRYGIITGKTSGETTETTNVDSEDWISQEWPMLHEGYEPDDIFSADKTELFYNMTPETSKLKEENSSDGKLETRLTIMVAANVTGSCKRKLLVIGKSKLSCFKNNSLPVTYENNSKSWITSEIFEKWLRNWDAELEEYNKKILLLVDYCPAHMTVTDLKYIKLVFLPKNATSTMPIEQVMRCLKSHYRKMQTLKLTQNDSNDQRFTVYDVILTISEAWENVSRKTIAKSFREAGFDLAKSDEFTEEDSISLSTTEAEFIDVDNSIPVCEATGDIVQVKVENDEKTEEEFMVPTLIDGLNAVSVLRKVVLFNEQFQTHTNNDYDNTLIKIQRDLLSAYARQSEQTLITEVKIEK